jgi:hypothetical protein
MPGEILLIKSGASPLSLLADGELGRNNATGYVHLGNGAANVLVAVPLSSVGAAVGVAASTAAGRNALGASGGLWPTSSIDGTTAATASKVVFRDANGDAFARRFDASLFASTGGFYLGGTRAFGGDGTTTVFYSPAATTGSIQFNNQANTAARFRVVDTGNISFGGLGSFGGGVLVTFIPNATTVPTTNPAGGGLIYSDGGAGKWRGSSGTTTTFGPAEPHCPVCGRDFMLEWDNPQTGYLAVCVWCMTEKMKEPWVIRRPSAGEPPKK